MRLRGCVSVALRGVEGEGDDGVRWRGDENWVGGGEWRQKNWPCLPSVPQELSENIPVRSADIVLYMRLQRLTLEHYGQVQTEHRPLPLRRGKSVVASR
jgi:hypothetical protein